MQVCVCVRPCVSVCAHRGPGVGEVTALSPGQVEAPDELQVEGVGGVEHGEAHDVGLLVHHVPQVQPGEVLGGVRGGERGLYTGERANRVNIGVSIDILYDRRSIECYRLLALTRRGAAILEWSSAPLSVIRLAGAMNCQRI